MVFGRPLSGDDVARLHMERRDNPMTITAIVWLRAPLSLAALEAVVRERLLARPRFRDRVVEHTLAGPRWEPDPDFDLRAHLHHLALPVAPHETALEELVEDLASAPLDPRIPLWQMHLVDGVGDGCALIVRVHHVIADGLALVDVLLGLTDERVSNWTPPSVPPSARRGALASLAPLVSLASLALSRREPATTLTAPHHAHKRLAWSRPMALSTLKAIAKRRGVGVTAIILALVTGSLRRVLEARGELTPSMVVRAMVPLSVRPVDEGSALGNHYATVFVGLPVGVAAPDARVTELRARLSRAVVTGGLSAGRALVRVASRVGAPIERIGVELLSRRASLVVSNVPGPTGAHRIAGSALARVVAFAPVSGAVGLGVTFLGYDGAVSVGVASGMSSPTLPREVIDGIARELEALSA